MSRLEVDSSKCIGCLSCVLACSLAKTDSFSYDKAVMKIQKDESRAMNTICSCSNCDERKCIVVCPVDAIALDDEWGIPVIDYEKCIYCLQCAENCVNSIIRIDGARQRVYKCDFCGGKPACASSCVPKAIRVVEEV